MLPIEIVNKILVYVGELNDNIIIPQYHLLTNKEYYKINFNSDLLWKIKSTLVMKRFYPILSCDFSKSDAKEIYKFFIPHYAKQLRLNKI
jgi:hypothetical protein